MNGTNVSNSPVPLDPRRPESYDPTLLAYSLPPEDGGLAASAVTGLFPTLGGGPAPPFPMLGIVLLGLAIGAALATSSAWAAILVAVLHGLLRTNQQLLRLLRPVYTLAFPFLVAISYTQSCAPVTMAQMNFTLLLTRYVTEETPTHLTAPHRLN